MKLTKLFIALLLVSSPLFAVKTNNNIDFGNILTNSNISKEIKIEAESHQVQIINIKYVGSKAFNVPEIEKSTLISPNSSFSFNISANHNQNTTEKGVIYIHVKENFNEFDIAISLVANFQFQGDYYSGSANLYGKQLIDWLKTKTYTTTSLTYKEARVEMWGAIDNVNGEVECVYTGKKVVTDGIPDVNTTKFNTEHTWPQAYGAENEPQKSDIFHIYPSYEIANSKRANLPFDFVANTPSYSDGGSKLGNNKYGTLVFEPRDAHKGNVARSIFYFFVRYNNSLQGQTFLNKQHEEALRQFMLIDPVDDAERKRCDEIEKLQKNRNPFIDHPEFVNRIFSFAENPDFPDSIKTENSFDFVQFFNDKDAELNHEIFVYNYGSKEAEITSITLEGTDKDFFAIPNFVSMPKIPAFSSFSIPISITKSTDQDKTAALKVNTSDNKIYTYNLKVLGTLNSIKDDIDSKITITPNPMKEKSIISISDPNIKNIKVFNPLGQLILELTPDKSLELNKTILSAYGNVFYLNFNSEMQSTTKMLIIE